MLGHIKVFILTRKSFLLLKLGQLMADGLKAVYSVLDGLCQVKVLVSDCFVLFLL